MKSPTAKPRPDDSTAAHGGQVNPEERHQGNSDSNLGRLAAEREPFVSKARPGASAVEPHAVRGYDSETGTPASGVDHLGDETTDAGEVDSEQTPVGPTRR